MLKKITRTFFCMLFPCLPILLFFFIGIFNPKVLFAIIYAMAVALVIVVMKNKLCNTWFLAVGFILPTLFAYISETLSAPYSFRYIGTWVIWSFYSLPFFVILSIIALIATLVKKGKQWKEKRFKETESDAAE